MGRKIKQLPCLGEFNSKRKETWISMPEALHDFVKENYEELGFDNASEMITYILATTLKLYEFDTPTKERRKRIYRYEGEIK